MAKYEWTEDMGEISGFGGGYEATCRAMMIAGLDWLEANPDKKPQFHGYKGVTGICVEDNDAAKELSDAVVKAANGDCTGAMHQYTIAHALRANHVGWDAYCTEMRSMNSERKATP